MQDSMLCWPVLFLVDDKQGHFWQLDWKPEPLLVPYVSATHSKQVDVPATSWKDPWGHKRQHVNPAVINQELLKSYYIKNVIRSGNLILKRTSCQWSRNISTQVDITDSSRQPELFENVPGWHLLHTDTPTVIREMSHCINSVPEDETQNILEVQFKRNLEHFRISRECLTSK